MVTGARRHVLLDVRKEVQFAVCALDKAVNVPLARLEVFSCSTACARPHSFVFLFSLVCFACSSI